jgi:DNA-directed RNA polymerase
MEELKKYNQIRVITSDNSEAYLEYRKMLLIRMDKKYKRARTTAVFQAITEEVDLRKIYQSVRPNLIHSIDACYVRLVLSHLPTGIITIHDSFGIDVLRVDILINAANYAINNLVPEYLEEGERTNFSSPYILL